MFIRRPSEANENIIVSTCAKCGAVVAGSASHVILRIAEQAHGCKPVEPPPVKPGRPRRVK